MAPIRLGVIGLSTQGWASTSLIPPLFDPLLSSKYILTALCTSSEASCAASVEKYTKLTGHPVHGYHGESGPRDIANDLEVDMVAVSVKVPDHYKTVMPAIEAGKDIFIEWAPGRNFEETVKIAEAARAKGIRCLVGAQPNQGNTGKKVKELVDSGKIGRVLSSSTNMIWPSELRVWGTTVLPGNAYGCDINNGASLLTIPVAHFLVILSDVLGDFSEVIASDAIRIPYPAIVDSSGKLTGRVLTKSVHDQVSLNGTLGGRHEGTFVTIHSQCGPRQGRFQWFIDGEDGTIEVRARDNAGPFSVFLSTGEMAVFLNGKEVEIDERVEDRLGNSGKAWLEFAKGDRVGQYETLEHSVGIYRVIDAAQKSIAEGRKVQVIPV